MLYNLYLIIIHYKKTILTKFQDFFCNIIIIIILTIKL